jgi:signal transduction histidine kinase
VPPRASGRPRRSAEAPDAPATPPAERHAAMFTWLVRDHIERLGRAGAELTGPAEEVARLRDEIAALETQQDRLLRELERGRTLADAGLLATGVVHDLNNLLTVIGGHAVMARANDDEQRRNSLDRIVLATQRASDLSRLLLRWVRHDEPKPEPCELAALAGEVLDLLSAVTPPGVAVHREFATDVPRALADPIEVRRVVLNLVTNAWQALGDRTGSVTVRTGAAEGRRLEAWLEVEDDGCGMSPDASARVFEPLFSTREHGSGLGLPIVQRIVDRLGGRVEVWSEPGRGARFRVSLPAGPISGGS